MASYRSYRKARDEALEAAQVQAACPKGENWKDIETVWAVGMDINRDCDDGNALDQAMGIIQTMSSQALAAAVRGELDLNTLARAQLASRGQNHKGEWVGFDESYKIGRTVHYINGVKVVIPPKEAK